MARDSRVLRDTQQVLSQLNTALPQLTQYLEKVAPMSRDFSEFWKEAADSLEDVVESTEGYLDIAKEITTQDSKLRSLRKDALKDTAAVNKALQKSVEAKEKLLSMTDKESDAYRLIKKNLEQTKRLQEGAADALERGVELAEDFTEELAKTAKSGRELQRTFQTMESSIRKISPMTAGFTKSLATIEKLGLLKGSFGKIEQMRSQMVERDNLNRSKVAKILGTKKVAEMSAADRKAAIDKMDEAGVYRGITDKFVSKGLTALASKAGSPGVLGALGRGAGSLVQGGSVFTGIAARAAGPVAVLSAIAEIFQQGFDRNKEIYAKLGGGGMIAGAKPTGLSDIYSTWSNYLTPDIGGRSIQFGMNFQKNMDTINAISNAGVGIAGWHEVLKNQKTSSIFDGPQHGLAGAVMRNEYLMGKPLGLGEGEGAALTMKLMKEFNLSLGGVEDMFKKLNMSVKVTGLTTTSYLNLLDNITSSFDKMAKAIQFSSNLINILGKNAKYTAEDLSAMIKSVMGDRKDLTMGTFAFQQMGAEERSALISNAALTATISGKALEAYGMNTNMSPEELRKAASKLPVDQRMSASNAVEQYIDNKILATALEKTKGDPLRMQGVVESMNRPDIQTAQQMSSVAFTLKNTGGAKMSDLVNNLDKVAGVMAETEWAQKVKALGMNPDQLLVNMSRALSQAGQEFEAALAGDKKSADLLGLSEKQLEAFKKMDPQKAKDQFLNSSNVLARAVKVAQEQSDMKAEELAKKNQKFIIGPLDGIRALMKTLVENIVNILQKLTKIVSFLGEDEDKWAEIGEGWLSKGPDGQYQTRQSILSVYDEEIKKAESAGDANKVRRLTWEKSTATDLLDRVASEGLKKDDLKDFNEWITTAKDNKLFTAAQLERLKYNKGRPDYDRVTNASGWMKHFGVNAESAFVFNEQKHLQKLFADSPTLPTPPSSSASNSTGGGNTVIITQQNNHGVDVHTAQPVTPPLNEAREVPNIYEQSKKVSNIFDESRRGWL